MSLTPKLLIKPPKPLIKPLKLLIKPPKVLIKPPKPLIKPLKLLIKPPKVLIKPSIVLIKPPKVLIKLPKLLIKPPKIEIKPLKVLIKPANFDNKKSKIVIFVINKLSIMTNKTSQATTKIHIGSILSSYINKKRIAQAAIARALGVKSSTLAYYLKQPSIKSKTLLEISKVLKYNFFMDIAQMLPDTYRTGTDIFEKHNKEIAQLEQQIAILQAEKAVLLESRK